MRAFFDHADHHTDMISTFWFKPERRFRFNPGEFAEFYLPHANTDNRGDTRKFTISSSPHEPLIGITVKFAAQAGSSFKAALRQIRPGDVVQISEPMGDFVLPKDSTIPLVFIGVGIGVTPMISIVRWLSTRDEKRTIHFFHIAAEETDLLGQELFENHTHYFPVVRTATQNRLRANEILQTVSNPSDSFFYLAGPKLSIQTLANDLRGSNIPREHIALDLFTGAIDIV